MTDKFKYVGKQLALVVVVLILAAIVFAVGLMVGYSVIGDSSNPWSILSGQTWSDVIGKLTGN